MEGKIRRSHVGLWTILLGQAEQVTPEALRKALVREYPE